MLINSWFGAAQIKSNLYIFFKKNNVIFLFLYHSYTLFDSDIADFFNRFNYRCQ
jgi:hypothetical protein